jgi:hypothetical protein
MLIGSSGAQHLNAGMALTAAHGGKNKDKLRVWGN